MVDRVLLNIFNDELNVVIGLVNLNGWDRIVKSEDSDLVARLGA